MYFVFSFCLSFLGCWFFCCLFFFYRSTFWFGITSYLQRQFAKLVQSSYTLHPASLNVNILITMVYLSKLRNQQYYTINDMQALFECHQFSHNCPFSVLRPIQNATVHIVIFCLSFSAGSRYGGSRPWWGHEENTGQARPSRIRDPPGWPRLYPTLYPPPLISAVVLVCPAVDSCVACQELSCSSFTEWGPT